VSNVELNWSPAPHYRRLVTVALVPLLAAIVSGRPAVLVLAAPLLAALALAARRPGFGARVTVETSGRRCFEDEEITIRAAADADGPASSARVHVALLPALAVTGGPAVSVRNTGRAAEAVWRVTAERWGRWDAGQIIVTVRSRGGLFTGSAAVGLGEITVFPHPPSLTQLALPAVLHNRIGDHVDRRPGDGVEFAGVRPFVLGDRLRRINWPVTSRRGALHVNQLAAEHAAEVVAIIDGFIDAGPPGRSSLDFAVRGAAGVARAYTRAGDRVGVVTLGGPLRWIAPGVGQRQFFQIVESVLDVRGSYTFVAPDLDRIPRTALPPGALVVLFTPLLDDRIIDVALDLRERGFAMIITDVLASVPAPRTALGALALRLWRLERQALRYRFESAGIPVVSWPGGARSDAGAGPGASLDPSLGRFARYPIRGRGR
jgi:uncharacterized protein (DUF58 family)